MNGREKLKQWSRPQPSTKGKVEASTFDQRSPQIVIPSQSLVPLSQRGRCRDSIAGSGRIVTEIPCHLPQPQRFWIRDYGRWLNPRPSLFKTPPPPLLPPTISSFYQFFASSSSHYFFYQFFASPPSDFEQLLVPIIFSKFPPTICS